MSNYFIKGDCIEGMKLFPDLYFDLAIVDLQQGNDNVKEICKKAGGTFGIKNVKRGNYKSKDWDSVRMQPEYFNELFRVSKNQIIWCGQFYTDMLPPSRGWLAWNKLNGGNHFADFELAWTSFDQPNRLFTFLWNGMMQGVSLANPCTQRGDKRLNEKRIHPTQKPREFYAWHLQKFATPGMRLLDTHVGSASSLIEFEEGGFEYVGFERDEDHYADAKDRMESHNPLYFNAPHFLTIEAFKENLLNTKQTAL